MTVFANVGALALWLLWIWLLSAIAASWLSNRKGYGERPGLATGLLLTALGALIWLVWPARSDSLWKTEGRLPRRRRDIPQAPEAGPPISGSETPKDS
jgi:hypothetical protein